MASKQVLNRQVQVLETALKELRKAHNNLVNEINTKTQCEDCRKVKVARDRQGRKKFDMLSASLLGAFTHTDYSAEPYKLFSKQDK